MLLQIVFPEVHVLLFLVAHPHHGAVPQFLPLLNTPLKQQVVSKSFPSWLRHCLHEANYGMPTQLLHLPFDQLHHKFVEFQYLDECVQTASFIFSLKLVTVPKILLTL